MPRQSLELAEELSLTTAELSYLQDRRQAFDNLGKRTGIPGVKAVTTALIQAERYGTPVGQALRVMAKENRDIRQSEAEKKAAALPPKLTVPMVLFFLPVLFVIILGPGGHQLLPVGLSEPSKLTPPRRRPAARSALGLSDVRRPGRRLGSYGFAAALVVVGDGSLCRRRICATHGHHLRGAAPAAGAGWAGCACRARQRRPMPYRRTRQFDRRQSAHVGNLLAPARPVTVGGSATAATFQSDACGSELGTDLGSSLTTCRR